MSGRLSDQDCKPLIEQITKRLEARAAKKLSYAGCLQSIQYVIHSLVNFWCSAFLLPKKVIKAVERKCKCFLWKNAVHGACSGAKVHWDTVCLPKAEGGLGVRELEAWNNACCLKIIWLLLCNAGSLWIAWLNEYVLKGRSFWEVKVPQFCSYAWRKLSKLRSSVYTFFKIQLGDGQRTLFWWDNWRDNCPLGATFRNKYGLSPSVTVAEAVNSRGPQRSFRDSSRRELQCILCNIF